MEEQIDLRVFVKSLIDNDDEAWLLLRRKVRDFLKKDKKFHEVLSQGTHPDEEFVNELIYHLKNDNNSRLKGCRTPEAFWRWLYQVELTVLSKLTSSKEILPPKGGGLVDIEGAKTRHEREMGRRDNIERLQITRTSFVKLWKENPQNAFIMFARFELDVSSKDVGAFLGITANNVDVMVNKVRKKLREDESNVQ